MNGGPSFYGVAVSGGQVTTGSAFDAKAFLQAHGLRTDAVWQAGDEFAGRSRREGGFNLTIVDAATGPEFRTQFTAWLQSHRAVLEALAGAGADGELDVGLIPGEQEFSSSVAFGPEALEILAKARVDLKFSVYASAEQ